MVAHRRLSLGSPSHSRAAPDPLLTVRGRLVLTSLVGAVAHHLCRVLHSALRGARRLVRPPARRALLESVDGCPLGTTLPRHSEAGPCRLPPLGARSCGRYPPPAGPRSHPVVALRRSTSVRWTARWETQWGQSDGRPGPV